MRVSKSRGFSLDRAGTRTSTETARMIRLALFSLLSLAAAASGAEGTAVPRASGALAHEAYVWQRAWTGPAITATAEHGSNFSTVVALAAELNWKASRPAVIRPAIH